MPERAHPIDRPTVRWSPGGAGIGPRGWKVTVHYEDRTQEMIWQGWSDAVAYALAAAGAPLAPWSRPGRVHAKRP